MRDTLIGITTMAVLFGMVWLSQNRSSNGNSNIANKTKELPLEQKYENTNETYAIEESNTLDFCEHCKEKSSMSDDIEFNNAFKICRECLGNEGTFMWKGNLYSTRIKEIENNEKKLIVEENIESIPPPEEKEEAVFSN